MRALELAVAVVLVALAGYLVYLLSDSATEDVPAWTLVVALVAPALLVALYLKQKFRVRAFYVLADRLYTWLGADAARTVPLAQLESDALGKPEVPRRRADRQGRGEGRRRQGARSDAARLEAAQVDDGAVPLRTLVRVLVGEADLQWARGRFRVRRATGSEPVETRRQTCWPLSRRRPDEEVARLRRALRDALAVARASCRCSRRLRGSYGPAKFGFGAFAQL